jgi:outer membrane protein
MKTYVSNLIKTSLAVTAIAIFAACNQTKTDSSPVVTANANPAKAEIVYVNSDSLLNKYEYFKDLSKRLQEKGKSANDDVVAKGQAFQREVSDYQKSAPTLSADQRQSTEQRLQRKNQELQAYKENATAQFQQENASEQSKLYDKIADFAKTYAKEKGYKLVLTYSKANPTVLFGDPTLDVTADVVKRLNDLYAKDKK